MGFHRQEYWSELPFPPLGNLPDPGIQPRSPALAGRFFTAEPPGKPISSTVLQYFKSERGLPTRGIIRLQGQIVNILGFVGHVVTVAT